MTKFKRAVRSAGRGTKRAIFVMLAVLLPVSVLTVVGISPASAHTQNMGVAVQCADGVYRVTYTLSYDNGVPDGNVYRRTGSTSFQTGWSSSTWSDWSKVKTVTNASGSVSWTTTLPGNTTVAPWEYSYVKWSDNYVTQGDTRPEGLKGDCKPNTPPTTEMPLPTVPVIDECGPGNAHFGDVPDGHYTVVRNGDGSITLTADNRYIFPGGKTSVTLPAPTDSNVPCPVVDTPAVPTAPSSGNKCEPRKGLTNDWFRIPSDRNFQYFLDGTPVASGKHRAVHKQYVIKAVAKSGIVLKAGAKDTWTLRFSKKLCAVKHVRGHAVKINKCGSKADLYRVKKSRGLFYTVKGKVIREGVWHKAKGKRVVIKAHATSKRYELKGKHMWVLRYPYRKCFAPPHVPPHTGLRVIAP